MVKVSVCCHLFSDLFGSTTGLLPADGQLLSTLSFFFGPVVLLILHVPSACFYLSWDLGSSLILVPPGYVQGRRTLSPIFGPAMV